MAIDLTQLAPEQLEKPPIKLVYFDIDGTLLNTDGRYSQTVKSAMLRLQERGILTAIASGRPSFAAQFLIDDLKLNAPGVFCTGAQIYYPLTGETLVANSLAPDLAARLIAAIRPLELYYELYTGEGFYIEVDRSSAICQIHAQALRCEPLVANFDSLVPTQPIYKILIGANQTRDAEKLQWLEAQFPECIFAYAGLPAHPEWLFASIIDRRADKLAAFNWLLNFHNLRAENVMSFGDAQSDRVFLQAAGTGIAMGNASAAVKAVANYVTKPVWEDGIAYALQCLIP